jgi:hypothetical protein
MVWRMIKLTNKQNRLLKEERLINIINEWAIDCAQYAIDLNQGNVAEDIAEKDRKRPNYLIHPELMSHYASQQVDEDTVRVLQKLRAKSVYIKNLIPKTEIRLDNLTDALIERIRDKLKFIHDPKGGEKWEKELLSLAESAHDLNKAIYKSAVEVTKEA